MDGMPRRYQNPSLEVRSDVERPYYFVRVTIPTVDGKRKRQVRILGFTDEVSKKQAMRLRAEVLDGVNAGRTLLQSQVLFKDLVAQFIAAKLPKLGAGTQYRYRCQIERHLLPGFGEKRLLDINRQQIEAWLVGKAEAGLAWWTREGLRGVMSSIFAAAKQWNLWSGDNPAAGIALGRKKETREKRPISADDFRRIIGAVEDPVRFIVLIAFGTGLRISEVLGLRWRNIDLEAGTLTVEQRWYRGDLDEPKTEASKRVRQLGPLTEEFRRRFPGTNSGTKFVFIGDDGHTPPDERDLLRFTLRPALKRLGVYYPGFGWHAFRRQNITWRQQEGATPLEAMKAAGHTRVDTTMLYTLTDSERERQQVERMFERLIGDPAGKPQ